DRHHHRPGGFQPGVDLWPGRQVDQHGELPTNSGRSRPFGGSGQPLGESGRTGRCDVVKLRYSQGRAHRRLSMKRLAARFAMPASLLILSCTLLFDGPLAVGVAGMAIGAAALFIPPSWET